MRTMRRLPTNCHIAFKGNKIIYRGNELNDIEKLDSKHILIHLGCNNYKKFKLDIVKKWLKIKYITFNRILRVWYEEDDEWCDIFNTKQQFTPIEFVKFITNYNKSVPFMNELTGINVCMIGNFSYKKVRIHFYDGTVKKTSLNKLISKYFDDNVF